VHAIYKKEYVQCTTGPTCQVHSPENKGNHDVSQRNGHMRPWDWVGILQSIDDNNVR